MKLVILDETLKEWSIELVRRIERETRGIEELRASSRPNQTKKIEIGSHDVI